MDQNVQPLPPASEPDRRLELRMESNPARVAEARRGVEQFAARAGFSDTQQADIGLCLNEALANVIRHAYSCIPGRPILITVECDTLTTPTEIRLTIRDWGNGHNPADKDPRHRDPLVPGGVGLICLRSLMDEVTFTPQDDGMILRMVKKK